MDDKTRQVLDQVMGAGCGFCGFLFTSPFHAQRCGGPNVIEIRNQALEEAAKAVEAYQEDMWQRCRERHGAEAEVIRALISPEPS
jgi:hypothetical protein